MFLSLEMDRREFLEWSARTGALAITAGLSYGKPAAVQTDSLTTASEAIAPLNFESLSLQVMVGVPDGELLAEISRVERTVADETIAKNPAIQKTIRNFREYKEQLDISVKNNNFLLVGSP